MPMTKEERKAYDAANYAAHAEERKARNAANYAAHAEERKAYQVAYNAAHAEEIKAYNAAHAEDRKAYRAAYHAATYVPTGDLLAAYIDGSYYYMRSMSEVYLAVYFADQGIAFDYESKVLDTPYGKYSPDYYIPSWNLWVEVKGRHWMEGPVGKLQAEKRAWLVAQGMHIAMMDSKDIDSEVGRYTMKRMPVEPFVTKRSFVPLW